MRVLHVIPSTSKVHGGPSHALITMERALKARGIEVTTATTDDDGPGKRLSAADKPSQANGAARIYAPKRTEFYKISPALGVWLARHAGDFDIVHIHALFSFASTAAAFAACCKGVPYVVRPLGTLNSFGVKQRRPLLKQLSFRVIEQRVLAHAAAIHFTSQAEWDEAKGLSLALPGVVIPLGVEVPEPGNEATPSFAMGPHQKTILFLSRLDPKKNVEGLIRAFAILLPRQSRARLVIAGSGNPDYVQSLRTLAKTAGVGDYIDWTGHLEGSAKWAAFKAANVFVLPSFSENFGIAAVEAMIAQLPCVIGSGVALAETIDAAGAGLMTEPEPNAIADALERLLCDDALSTEMGKRAKQLAEMRFSSDEMARRLEELYASIIGSGTANFES